MLEATKEQLKIQHPKLDVMTLTVDVTDEESVDKAVEQIVQHFGKINIAINCAGIGGNPNPTAEMPLRDWQKVIDVNQTGLWICQRALIRQMLKQEYVISPIICRCIG